MGLLQRKPVVESGQQLYTLSSQKQFLIVGLGNPGAEYKDTRHNIGFEVLEYFADQQDFTDWNSAKKQNTLITIGTLGSARVILTKPQTYMNDSGQAVQAVQHFYKIPNSQTLVVYDELAIDFGQLRTRIGGSDGGHNGVKSIIAHCGEDFGRLRIGIGPGKGDAAKFVLGKFSTSEKKLLPEVIKESAVLISEYIFSGALSHETRSIL